mgnify:CR=1 FL=1
MNQTEEKTMFKNAGRVKRTIEEYFVLTVATLILVVGVYVFKFPNNFSFGGVTGIAVVLSAIMPTTPGNITFIINMALLVLGFIFLGIVFAWAGYRVWCKRDSILKPVVKKTKKPRVSLADDVIELPRSEELS